MAWKHRGQPGIHALEGDRVDSSFKRYYFEHAYQTLESARRGTDLIVDCASEVNISITGKIPLMPPRTNSPTDSNKVQFVRQKNLFTKLNFFPNPEEDINSFRRQLYTDLILTGNAYIYWDGTNMWQLPSKLMQIETGKRQNKISKYIYDGNTTFTSEEIIHIKDNSSSSVYVGESRLKSASNSIRIVYRMLKFQESFFENGAVPGLILTTPNILGDKIKRRMLDEWNRVYSPDNGGRRPIILDGDLKVNPLSNVKYGELDLEASLESRDTKILKALGVPPILLESGNNANIRPNLQLFYETTVLPLTVKVISALESFFGYDMEPDVANIRALRPELRDAGQYFTGLVNGGIMTINEARAELRLPPSSEEHADKLRIPANIAGSAVNPGEGGRPPGNDDNEDDSEESND